MVAMRYRLLFSANHGKVRQPTIGCDGSHQFTLISISLSAPFPKVDSLDLLSSTPKVLPDRNSWLAVRVAHCLFVFAHLLFHFFLCGLVPCTAGKSDWKHGGRYGEPLSDDGGARE
jgi:hypothetical protein